eukprot:4199270-Prymnesium_polylepis.1
MELYATEPHDAWLVGWPRCDARPGSGTPPELQIAHRAIALSRLCRTWGSSCVERRDLGNRWEDLYATGLLHRFT